MSTAGEGRAEINEFIILGVLENPKQGRPVRPWARQRLKRLKSLSAPFYYVSACIWWGDRRWRCRWKSRQPAAGGGREQPEPSDPVSVSFTFTYVYNHLKSLKFKDGWSNYMSKHATERGGKKWWYSTDFNPRKSVCIWTPQVHVSLFTESPGWDIDTSHTKPSL